MRIIDADALRMKITSDTYFFNMDDLIAVRHAIDKAPAVDAAPMVRGKWHNPPYGKKWGRAPFNDVYGICDVCEEGSPFKYPCCPHCGAKMAREVKHDTQTDL